METIILSVVGIVLLIAIAYFFSSLEIMKGKKAEKQLDNLRKSLSRKSDWLLNAKNDINSPAFRRPKISSKLNIFPSNGDTPVL